MVPSVIDHGQARGASASITARAAASPAIARQIGLGQQHDIGAGDLILEHLGQGRFMVKAVIRRALRIHRRHIGGKAARRHRLGIGQRDHPVDGDARPDRGPVKGLQQGLGSASPEVSIRM
jgi:hypothetical protein